MDKMQKILLISYFIMAMLDILNISDARKLLLDFLIGQRNRKNAMKIHSEQRFKDRINMGYIYPMLKKHKPIFRKYNMLYLVMLSSIIPQYVSLILCHFFVPNVVMYLVGVCILIRIILAVFLHLELGPQRMSVYAQKYLER